MLLAFAAIVAGLVLLVWSSDKFVDGAVGLAESSGISKAMIGLTIVALGTSAPEIVVSIMSALSESSELAYGNAVGSNIANVGLVLGITTLIAALPVKSGLLKEDLPALLAVTAATGFLLYDHTLSRNDGLAMLAMLVALMLLMIRYKKEHADELISPGEAHEIIADVPALNLKASVMWFVVGLVVLVGASRLLVWGAIEVAQAMGVSEIVIGLTIVAVGTSLPELASSIIAARKGEHDIALGNILGSNLFNTLAVVGIAGAIHPLAVGPEVFNRDMLVMAALTLSLFVIGYGFRGSGRINRIEGAVLLACYVGYTAYLISTVFGGQA